MLGRKRNPYDLDVLGIILVLCLMSCCIGAGLAYGIK